MKVSICDIVSGLREVREELHYLKTEHRLDLSGIQIGYENVIRGILMSFEVPGKYIELLDELTKPEE